MEHEWVWWIVAVLFWVGLVLAVGRMRVKVLRRDRPPLPPDKQEEIDEAYRIYVANLTFKAGEVVSANRDENGELTVKCGDRTWVVSVADVLGGVYPKGIEG